MDPLPTAQPAGTAPLPAAYWVLPGRLLAGGHPVAALSAGGAGRLSRLLECGIDCFIDLTEEGELTAYQDQLPHGIQYWRKPLPDHGIPAEPGHMREILECLERALGTGRVIYLHCRAGIGRTGMVAGCLLAEQGRPGNEALIELNRLWQQNTLARHWPNVPETDAQTAYVRGWMSAGATPSDPLLAPEALSAARGLRARFQGALLGLAVGDAVAAATQYRRPGRFAPVGDLIGGGPFDLPRGGWSDDTAMALCLAESLLECDGFDARDQLARYRRWQREGYLSATGQCLGITAGTARALAVSQWRRQPFPGTHDPQALEPEALSRVAPVVMYYFAQSPLAIEQAAEAARTTSQAPLVLSSCRALGEALHTALSGQPREVIVARASRLAAPPLPPPAAAARADQAAGATDTAPAVLAVVMDVFQRTHNFRDAVLSAVNLGGNSDVTGAVCGALAGAHYSSSAIPASWRNSLMKQQLIEALADRLLTRALLEMGA